MIKAIETRYAGCRFRSRLEARWAVFFDTAGIPWEYEPQGFELSSGWYLPDFFLPTKRGWVEVKGTEPSHKDVSKCLEFAGFQNEENLAFILLQGDIPRVPVNGPRGLGIPALRYVISPVVAVTEATPLKVGDSVYHLVFGIGDIQSVSRNEFGLKVDVEFDEGTKRLSVRHANLKLAASSGLVPATWFPQVDALQLADALRAARAARFEHGEKG